MIYGGRIEMKRNLFWLVVALGGLALLAPTADSRAAELEEVGKVHFESDALGGELLARGEVLLDHGLVRTESTRAMVHLDNGQVLKFEPNSAARFEALSFDQIQVTVFSGRVVKWSARGRALSAGAGSRFTIGPSLQDPLDAERELLKEREPKRVDKKALGR
jgi:hypothetical protein